MKDQKCDLNKQTDSIPPLASYFSVSICFSAFTGAFLVCLSYLSFFFVFALDNVNRLTKR